MKRIFLSVIGVVLCMLDVSAQKDPNKVYVSSKSPVCIDLPKQRNVYGGTIINVIYVGSKVSETVKNAFEYACKIRFRS